VNLYACHNKPRSDGYWVKDGLNVQGDYDSKTASYNMKYIKDTMSRNCNYDCKKTDARCEGCER
jgi:hypothetical protein